MTRPESGANREIDMKSTLDVDVGDGAGEVGEEDQRALEHADEHDAVGMIGRDLAAEPPHVPADRRAVEQDRRRHIGVAHVSR